MPFSTSFKLLRDKDSDRVGIVLDWKKDAGLDTVLVMVKWQDSQLETLEIPLNTFELLEPIQLTEDPET
jgi:hypothetical protein